MLARSSLSDGETVVNTCDSSVFVVFCCSGKITRNIMREPGELSCCLGNEVLSACVAPQAAFLTKNGLLIFFFRWTLQWKLMTFQSWRPKKTEAISVFCHFAALLITFLIVSDGLGVKMVSFLRVATVTGTVSPPLWSWSCFVNSWHPLHDGKMCWLLPVSHSCEHRKTNPTLAVYLPPLTFFPGFPLFLYPHGGGVRGHNGGMLFWDRLMDSLKKADLVK